MKRVRCGRVVHTENKQSKKEIDRYKPKRLYNIKNMFCSNTICYVRIYSFCAFSTANQIKNMQQSQMTRKHSHTGTYINNMPFYSCPHPAFLELHPLGYESSRCTHSKLHTSRNAHGLLGHIVFVQRVNGSRMFVIQTRTGTGKYDYHRMRGGCGRMPLLYNVKSVYLDFHFNEE